MSQRVKTNYKVTTKAGIYPVSSTEVKNHLKVEHTDDDTLIAALIEAATFAAENYCNRSFLPETVTQYQDSFNTWDRPIYLHRNPARAITSVKYQDSDNVQQTLVSGTDYLLDSFSEPARVYSLDNWPTTKTIENAVEIIYTAGYDDAASVPGPIRAAILLIIADLYENREDRPKRLPSAAEYLLDPYRVKVY